MFGEVVFFTCLVVNDNNGGLRFVDVALVRSFSPPNPVILQTSHQTLPHCHTMDAVLVVQVHDIVSVVAMIPHTLGGEDFFFAVEQPRLVVTHFIGWDGVLQDDDEDNEDLVD